MKETLYQVKKNQKKEEILECKERRRVIKDRIRECNSTNYILHLNTLLMAITGTFVIGSANKLAQNKTALYLEYIIGSLMIVGSVVLSHIGKDTKHKEELIELKKQIKEINEHIKSLKTKDEKDEQLKKIYVEKR